MKPVNPILIAILFLFASTNCRSETPSRFAIGANYYALTYHPGGGGAKYPRELDKKAYWVVQVGAESNIDYYVLPWLLVRGAGSLFRDCADVWAGYAHLGFRLNWNPTSRASFRIGIGPTLLWRESWLGKVVSFKGNPYTGDPFYGNPKSTDKYQSRWIIYGGNMEAEWKINRSLGLIYSLVPGFPFVITSSVGLRKTF